MATIIPCSNIEQEADRLLQLFRSCYTLTAQDMDDLVNLVYSASLCGTGEGSIPTFDQNNLFTYQNTQQSLTGEADPVTAINALPQFEVDEKQIVIFIHTYLVPSDIYRSDFVTEYYILMTGKGTYGAGGTQISDSDLFFVRSTQTSLTTPPGSTSPPRLLYLYAEDVGGATISTPHTILNGIGDLVTITDDQDTYFAVYEEKNAVGNEDYNLYRFIGTAGDYGGGGTETAVIGDFLLVETVSGGGSTGKGNGQIKIREINVPAIIDPNGTFTSISSAINNSFRGTINAEENEIVVFIVDEVLDEPVISPADTIQLVTRKWAWINGEQTSINVGSVDSDYTVIETLGTTTVNSPGQTNPAAVYYVEWDDVTDVNDAVDAVNSLTGSDRVVLNDNLVLVKVSLDDGSNNYKVWEFTGATTGNGTYGDAGLTAVAGDFNPTPVADGTEFDSVIKASAVLYDDTVTNLGVFNVQEAIEALDTAIDSISDPTGFETVDEGNGDGLVKVGRTAANFGNVGLRALDASYSSAASSVRGATGDYSFAMGLNVTASNDYDWVGGTGMNDDANRLGSFFSAVNIAYGAYQSLRDNITANAFFGERSDLGHVSTGGSDYQDNCVFTTLHSGGGNRLYGGWGSSMQGVLLLSGAGGSMTIGVANKDLTQGDGAGNGNSQKRFGDGSSDTNAPRLIVGAGSGVTYTASTSGGAQASSATTRDNVLVAWGNGVVSAPMLTNSLIDTPNNPVLVSGTTTSTSANELVDSGATFTTNNNISVGDIVYNSTDLTSTTIVSIDSDTTLTLTDDIMTTGEDYEIQPKGYAARVLITKEYFDANVTSVFEGYDESGTRAGADLQVTLGDYDDSGNGTRLFLDDNTESVLVDADYFTLTKGSDDEVRIVIDEQTTSIVDSDNINAGIFFDDQGESNQATIGLTDGDIFSIETDAELSIKTGGSGSDMRITTDNNGNNIDFDAANFGNIQVDIQSGGWFVYDETAANIDSGPVITVVNKDYIEQNVLDRVKVTLSAAEIKNLGTTPIEAIAAPGAGKYIKVVSTEAWLNWNSVAFDANYFFLSNPSGNAQFRFGLTSTKILDQTVDTNGQGYPLDTTTLNQFVENEALNVTGVDSVATGDSTLDIYITYQIITR